jgi:hypothetical protein
MVEREVMAGGKRLGMTVDKREGMAGGKREAMSGLRGK